MSAKPLLCFVTASARNGTSLRDTLMKITDRFIEFDFDDPASIATVVIDKIFNVPGLNDQAVEDFDLLVDCIVAYNTAVIDVYHETGEFGSHERLGYLVGLGAADRPHGTNYMEFYDLDFRHGLTDGRWLGLLPDFYEMAKSKNDKKH
ncbi:MAG: hypothetical protein HKM24_05275 [Gammaproteobacteria bacterium]|nr:hypothetical protein [Gammaproteobacteria bacterium]